MPLGYTEATLFYCGLKMPQDAGFRFLSEFLFVFIFLSECHAIPVFGVFGPDMLRSVTLHCCALVHGAVCASLHNKKTNMAATDGTEQDVLLQINV